MRDPSPSAPTMIQEIEFAADSSLEGAGFEPSVPLSVLTVSGPPLVISRFRSRLIPRGTDGLQTRSWRKEDSNRRSHLRSTRPMNPRISLGGERLRVRLSNAYGNQLIAWNPVEGRLRLIFPRAIWGD